MNKYYVVKLIDNDYDNPVLEFAYRDVDNALDREEKLVELVESAENDELSVVIETRFDEHWGFDFKDKETEPEKEYRKVTGSSGDEYITAADTCSCPSAFYNGPDCKHQGFFRSGLYQFNQRATQEDYDAAITERGRARRW